MGHMFTPQARRKGGGEHQLFQLRLTDNMSRLFENGSRASVDCVTTVAVKVCLKMALQASSGASDLQNSLQSW